MTEENQTPPEDEVDQVDEAESTHPFDLRDPERPADDVAEDRLSFYKVWDNAEQRYTGPRYDTKRSANGDARVKADPERYFVRHV